MRELAGGDPRIEFLGLVSEERLRDLYARALVTIFPPINEDLGLITLESFAAAKPVSRRPIPASPPRSPPRADGVH